MIYVMVRHRDGAKPLSEPITDYATKLVTRPRWVDELLLTELFVTR